MIPGWRAVPGGSARAGGVCFSDVHLLSEAAGVGDSGER